MKITLTKELTATDALFVFVSEKDWKKKSKLFDKKLVETIESHFEDKNFNGEKGEVFQIPSLYKKTKKLFLVGAGKLKTLDDCRIIGGNAIRKAKKIKANKISFLLPENICTKRVISGSILGNYAFKIGKNDFFTPKELLIVTNEKLSKQALQSEIALGEATNLTRDLINLPPNLMNPNDLANEAKKIEKGINNPIKVTVLGEKEMEKLKMGSLLGVGLGSHEESKLIVLEYNGGQKKEAPLALVGKGVCFDSGGYHLKPTNHIEEMKSDMSGAATVLGIFKWLVTARPKKNIIGVIGAVENLVNGKAFKPGDILTAMNGKTIEITNTDAEGRLVLADCLYYVTTKFKPSKMIDIATLTGSCIQALGFEITGLVSNDEKLTNDLTKAAKSADENVWELPLNDFLRKKTKGEVADLLNWSPGVSAGCSMGGAFLENFVEKTPWVHIDIAGTSFHSTTETSTSKKGATGVMMRTLKTWLED
ncbi:leucyl aminopeptidase [Candidatus Gracilibacteria bacterium]|nr:leucyl aminopeptidase [Candidatus Gracilibacteria bacterium]